MLPATLHRTATASQASLATGTELAGATQLAATRWLGLSDDALLAEQSVLVAKRREIDASLAEISGEIDRRSSRELGFSGLAQQHGHRSAADFISVSTGLSRQEAAAMLRVATVATPSVADAVRSGSVSIAAASAIIRGLGEPDGRLSAEVLDAAADALLPTAAEVSPESLADAARELRATLDADSIVDRERELRGRRSLRLVRQEDGMTRLTALLDPESAAAVRSVLDSITAPRRGGPRFVAPEEADRVRRLERDPRTTDQLALDGFVEVLRLGADVAPAALVGAHRPAVRVHVTDADLRHRGIDPDTGRATGSGRLEGAPELVSIATVERHICTSGTVPIHFDSTGQVVNVGRDHRLFTPRQRIGLAARDGGCRWPGCERPPSWCEAHHIDEWQAHGGRTDIASGILLCRFHHLLVHDQGWRIHRGERTEAATYWAERDTQSGRRRRPAVATDGSDDPGPVDRHRVVARVERVERVERIPLPARHSLATSSSGSAATADRSPTPPAAGPPT